jgi:hypothetical protein
MPVRLGTGSMGKGPSPQASQACPVPGVGAAYCGEASDPVVARADRWMVEAHIPGLGQTGVIRDHLSQPLHSSPWRIVEGITGAFAPQPCHAPLAPSHRESRESPPHQRYAFHQRTAGHGRGGIGKVPVVWQQKQSDCHAGRAPQPLCDAGKGGWKRCKRSINPTFT